VARFPACNGCAGRKPHPPDRDAVWRRQWSSQDLCKQDEQCLFPGTQPGGHQDEHRAVAPGKYRALGLPLEHDELLAQQGVLQHELHSAAGQIQGCIGDKCIVARLGPAAKKVCDNLTESMDAVPGEGKEVIAWLARQSLEATILPQIEETGHNSWADGVSGQHSRFVNTLSVCSSQFRSC
jgi:hypothetical protein